MAFDDLSESGIQRIAEFSSYLGQLGDVAELVGARQREDLMRFERCLHEQWRLGQNTILSWARVDDGVLVLVVPHYAIADCAARPDDGDKPRLSTAFITRLITGERQLLPGQMREVARLFEVEPVHIQLDSPIADSALETQIVEKMIRRYGVNYVASRAVTLFDIVGFGLLTPFEQMTQLNSLSYSLNWALAKMLEQDVSINFARTSTGDGFYVWNRDGGLEANVNLYHFLHIVLADNALARAKASSRAVPHLRACFHVGSCYEFHQAEGLNPTMHDFIVGDVTVELARMIDAALPGQILVGDFVADLPTDDYDPTITQANLDAFAFLQRAQGNLAKLSGMNIAGERVSAIKCYLTGERMDNGEFGIRRLQITDKHGFSRVAYNAKVNIYRDDARPILLGIEDKKLPQGQ